EVDGIVISGRFQDLRRLFLGEAHEPVGPTADPTKSLAGMLAHGGDIGGGQGDARIEAAGYQRQGPALAAAGDGQVRAIEVGPAHQVIEAADAAKDDRTVITLVLVVAADVPVVF